MRIGILTAGGDCPGLNSAIRAVGKAAILEYGMEAIGFSSGFSGLINNEYITLDEQSLSGILTLGGTILRTSREKPFRQDNDLATDKPSIIKKNYKDLGLDCLICIGGNGTMKTAYLLYKEGMNVIGIPKTIDNDVFGTDLTFGFDSALTIATEAIDRLHTTANSHKRIMVIELMGHNAGWLTLYAGLAGGGDVILIPEIEYDIRKVIDYVENRAMSGKPYSIVVVAEGIKRNSKMSAGSYISERITEFTGLETRETILGYIQRGGTPTPNDRILATRFGSFAASMIANREFGQMVALRHNNITSIA